MLLSIQDLSVAFRMGKVDGVAQRAEAVRRVSFDIPENAIVALQSAQRREAEFRVALDAANNQTLLARLQYRSGLTDFTTLNQAESSLVSARNGIAQAQSDQSTALIQLYLALGGGWDSNVTPTAPEQAPTNGN